MMLPDYISNITQSQAMALDIMPVLLRDAIEFFKYLFMIIRIDPDTIVRNIKSHRSIISCQLHFDDRMICTIFQCIVKQVVKHTTHMRLISIDYKSITLLLERNLRMLLVKLHFHMLHHFFQYELHIKLFVMQKRTQSIIDAGGKNIAQPFATASLRTPGC